MLLALVIVAPALVAMAYNANLRRTLALNQASADALQTVGLVAQTEAQYVEQARQILVRLSELPSIQSGLAGGCRLFAYSVSKGALLTMTRNLAKAYARHKIRVNYVIPVCVITEKEI